MIAPALLDKETEELHREGNVLKEHRKMRVAARESCLRVRGRQGLFMTSCALSVVALRDRRAVSGSRRRGSGRRQQKPVDSWVSEALGVLRCLSGRPPGSTTEKLTLGQELGVRNISKTFLTFGGARRELRRTRPGYDLNRAKAVLHTEGSVAVPCDAVEANLDGVLTRDMLVHWQDHILCGHESQGTRVRVHFDPRLKSPQRLCLRLLMQMVRAGKNEFADYAETSRN